MMGKLSARAALRGCAVSVFICARSVLADPRTITQEQFEWLKKQNELLLQQVQKQQVVIDSLTRKVSGLEEANAKRDKEAEEAKPAEADGMQAALTTPLNKIHISGEGGIAYFHSQSKGTTPNAEFRVDEARLFLEAPVWRNVYFSTELDLALRESPDLVLRAAEIYLDFEDLSQLWGRERQANLRIGKFYIPFGEEYQNRFAIDNPLISHSVSDLWGADEGVELYGALGRVAYAVAVQNGGWATSQDFNADKAVAGRVGYDPTPWLHLSVSGMRTGDLDAVKDMSSELWFGNGWFRSLGSPGTTVFHANLVEGDVAARLPGAWVRAAGGYINYGDNDPMGHNHRDVYYYYVEGVKDITKGLYAAARFSQVFAPNGMYIVGNGPMGQYFFGNTLTTDYWRLSLGLGYRFSPGLLVKGEYSFNMGHELDGEPRRLENLFALEAAFRF